jgi:hypothetical protein
MIDMRIGRNDLCPCGSGKKFKKCCRRSSNGIAQHINGHPPQSLAEPTSPTFWSHPPGQPNAAPPAGGEWVEYVFVKDKGWTHQSELKPGDQCRLKGGGWETVEPERVIGTTDEHPFFVQGKGWTPLSEIRPGDVIRTDSGWVPVTKIENTGRYEKVYNLRVQDYHTYFVGGEDWGFAVWAHNAYDATSTQSIQKLLEGKGQLKDLLSSKNIPKGVSIAELIKKSPVQLEQMVKDGDLSSKVLKMIKKAFEGRDLGGRRGG